MRNQKHRYGYIPDLMDFRDKYYRIAKPVALPSAIDLRDGMPPVYDQGDLGSCTANAIAAAFDFERKKQGKDFMQPSRLFIYFNERVMEGTVNEDSGAMIRDGIKSVAKLGVCPESDWPYDISQFTVNPDDHDYVEALNNQVLGYTRIDNDVDAMLQCIASGYPFVFGFSVYESFETQAVAETGIVPMPESSESVLGGHAVVACGYNLANRQFLVRNSWSDTWGIAGYCWMSFDYLSNSDLANDLWQIRLVEV